MSKNEHSDLSFPVRSLFTIIQVALALLSDGNQAATITVSPSSLVVPSLTILNNSTTNSLSTNETKTTSVRTNSIVSSVFLTSSSKNAQSVLHSRYTKTWTKSSRITMSQTASTSVTQFNSTNTPALTPTTVLIVKGLPSVKVVVAIAGVLGAILLILLAIIVWNLCIAEVVHTRRSSRIVPSDVVTEGVSEVF